MLWHKQGAVIRLRAGSQPRGPSPRKAGSTHYQGRVSPSESGFPANDGRSKTLRRLTVCIFKFWHADGKLVGAGPRPAQGFDPAATIGRRTCDGCPASWKTVLSAGTRRRWVPSGSPVLGFTSNLG